MTIDGTFVTGNVALGAGADTFVLAGNGTLAGSLRAGGGNDIVTIGGNNVSSMSGVVDLGAGDDALTLQNSTLLPRIIGGDGAETIEINAGATVNGRINLGAGNDTLSVNGATDSSIEMGNGDDQVTFGATGSNNGRVAMGEGNDTLTGSGSSETLLGNAGHDSIDGGAGFDLIYGHSGDDTLLGGDGGDTIHGGGGADVVTGGAGSDVFQFASGHNGPNGMDTITDFTQGEDEIELAGFAANGFFLGTDSFGSTRFSGFGLIFARYDVTASGVTLEVDFDDDGVADLSVALTGLTTLTEADLGFLFD